VVTPPATLQHAELLGHELELLRHDPLDRRGIARCRGDLDGHRKGHRLGRRCGHRRSRCAVHRVYRRGGGRRLGLERLGRERFVEVGRERIQCRRGLEELAEGHLRAQLGADRVARLRQEEGIEAEFHERGSRVQFLGRDTG
jgi:hypothetical protein